MALAAVAASLSTTAGFVATASPAEADASDCPSGAACIWRDTSFETQGNGDAYVAFWLQIPHYDGWAYEGPLSLAANDSASSASSNGNDCRYKAYFYEHGNYNGGAIAFERNTGDANLSNSVGNAGKWFNNIISSGRFEQVRNSC